MDLRLGALMGKSRIGLLSVVIGAGFFVIFSGVVFLSVQTTGIMNTLTSLTAVRQAASRLTSLSKDLLITENLLQGFDAWKQARLELSGMISEFLDDPSTRRGLSGEDGSTQEANTRRLMELLAPKLDRVETIIDGVMKANSTFATGLLDLKTRPGAVVKDSEIAEVRNFSLYAGDLLNIRMDNLGKVIEQSARSTLAFTTRLLVINSALIVLVVILVLRALALSRRRIEETTHYLEGVLSAIYGISGQGFLTFGSGLTVDREMSRSAGKLLGRDPAGLDITTLLWEKKADQADFRDGVDLILSGKARPEVVFDLFEKESRIGDHWIRINFSSLPNNKIMLALTDVTREHALQDLRQVEEDRKAIILKAVSRRQYFSGFVKDASSLFAELAGYGRELDGKDGRIGDLMRHLHSLKGNASFFGFRNTASLAHDCEYLLSDARVLGSVVDLEELGLSLKKAYLAELGHLTGFLGEAWLEHLDSVAIPLKTYLHMEHYLRARYGHDRKLLALVASQRRVQLRQLFERFPEMALGLAEQTGKIINTPLIEGGDFPVMPERFGNLVQNLVHLVRNMVDHGIETAAEREAAGKNPKGSILIKLDRSGSAWMISFADDGRGLDFLALEVRAREKRLLEPEAVCTREMLLGFLVEPGLSSASQVTEISGRGIGMGAVAAAVRNAGGTLAIQSLQGRGTEYDIIIPFRKERT